MNDFQELLENYKKGRTQAKKKVDEIETLAEKNIKEVKDVKIAKEEQVKKAFADIKKKLEDNKKAKIKEIFAAKKTLDEVKTETEETVKKFGRRHNKKEGK